MPGAQDSRKMPEMTETPAQPPILNNARVKGAPRAKTVGKIRKARPLKNLELSVLNGRLVEIQKRVRTAECKITLLKEKLVVHEDELTARVDVPSDTLSV
jgi:hypothetical protein